MSRALLSLAILFVVVLQGRSTSGQAISKEQVVFLTAEWKGERFADGRPKVPDSIVSRMKKVSIEEAWETLRTHGYSNKFEGGWEMVNDGERVVGRAMTGESVAMMFV